jgi:antitoxin MazE
MKVVVKKWGNSAAIRIPASVMAAVSIQVNQAVDVHEEDGRIVVEPIKAPSYDLDALLDEMRSETFPDDIDFGPPKGREMW